ncbi:tail protein [Pectobacterium phage PP81]|uniref:Tail tubular protein B n=1 Tax=Pectobacterium phage PP81 TaxID=1927014 RepID=A0A3B8G586_9CAUD|nr:tail protein [Pectobacterium phage PP81]AYM47388.1 tail tubular protein B [Pectobacterium phage PP81]
MVTPTFRVFYPVKFNLRRFIMALVSQTTKNLKSGISQQPDILRYPEQGAVQINGWSSETEGLQKRPPLVFSKVLGAKGYLGTNPYIHLINRDEFEQYYACFTGTGVKVFDLTGNEYIVRGDTSYVTVANPREDLRMVTIADYTFIVNRTKVVDTLPDVSLPNFREKGSALINIRGGQYGRTLLVYLNDDVEEVAKLELPNGSDPSHVKQTDSQYIAEELAKQIRLKLPTWTITVGTGYVYIEAPVGTDIDKFITKDGYADQLIAPVTHFAQSFNKLPANAPDGYIIKIVGDTSKTADQYYVKWDAARKVWGETIGWGSEYKLDPVTMPWALVRAADGNFDLKMNTWTERKCGDEDTNPFPSFVDSKINDVFFWRNRLGFLSGENVILSRTAKYFGFFPTSVANLSDDDPIDVAVSHNRVSTLKYAVPFTEEMLIWADEAQFVMNAQGVLSSRSVELNLTTQFDVYDKARPYGIGRNIYFASPRATFTSINRYYAVQDVSSVKNAEDMTSHVPSYIPNGVFQIHGSATENYASVLTSGAESKVFLYKFLYQNETLQQQSWSHWDFGDNIRILSAASINSTMFLILENNGHVFMGYVLFTKDTVDYQGEPYRGYLDGKKAYTVPVGAYNEDTNETTVNISTVYGMGFDKGTISALEADGRVTSFEEPQGGWAANPTITFDGNLEGVTLFLGFNFLFTYEFSKFLIKKQADDGSIASEDTGRLQLRRAWVNYEDSGAFRIEVQNQSRTFEYLMGGARVGSQGLRASRLNVATGQYRFPVNGDARLNTVRIFSDYTTPLNVIGCGWEGNYMKRTTGI